VQYVSRSGLSVLGLLLQAEHELCNNVGGLFWLSLKNQVRSINARDFDLWADARNLFEARRSSQSVLLGLYEKNGYRDFLELGPHIDREDLAQSCCKDFRFDRADCRFHSCVK